MASSSPSGTGMTVFVRVCPQFDPTAPLSKRASAVLDKKGSFASSFSLKNSFVSSKTRNPSLLAGNTDRCIISPDDKTIRVLKSGAAAREGDKEYSFDRVFPEDSSQEEVCINVHDHVLEVVSGFNVTVICHGASKSGKSFTMTGTKDARGIIPHAIKSVFAHIDKIRAQEPDLYFYAELGYVELYNNTFRDLLFNSGGSAALGQRDDGDDDSVVVINEVGELDSILDGSTSGKKSARTSAGGSGVWSVADEQKIQVHESKNLGVFLAGSPTLRVAVSSAQDVFQLYSSGQKVRSSRVTETGHVSSRSHAILILYLESRAFTGEAGAPSPAISSSSPGASPDAKIMQAHQQAHPGTSGLRMSKLTFVDMAGADRLELSGAVGDTLVESQNINLSLNAFGDVLFALSKNAKAKQGNSGKGMQHVPYLNSKLTQLLKESLGGNAKTVMITTIHATTDYSKVTETSLQYATWARAVRGRVVRNDLNIGDRWIAETDPEILRLKKLLEERSRDFAKLRVAQLNRPPLPPTPSSSSSLPPMPSISGAGTPAGGSPNSSPLKNLQKRLSEPNNIPAPESKSSGPDNSSSLRNRISDLELTNLELKEDVARKSRQSADLSMSLKKSLELIQQQNKALTDQLNDVSNDKDAQIAVLNERVAALQADLALQGATNAGDADEALNAANAELERAKKSAWDRYLTITQQQEQITTLEQALQLETSKSGKSTREADERLTGKLAESQAALDEQKRALDQERANLHAALKAAEDHVYEQEVHLQEQHASQAYQINTLKDKCDALQAELAAKEAELAKARTQSKEAQEKLGKESRQLTAEAAKASDLQASLDMHIALVSSLKLKMATLQGHMTEETAKRADKEAKNKDLEREAAELRAELDRLRSEHETHQDDLTGMLQDSSVELQNLVNLVNTKEGHIKNLEARLAAITNAANTEKLAAQAELAAVQAQLREQADSHQQLSAKYLQKNSEAETIDSNFRSSRTQIEDLTTELSILRKKYSVQEEFYNKEKTTSSELTQALQKAHKLHEASVNQFTDELLDLNVKLQTSNNLAQELNRTIHDYERQIETLRARLDESLAMSEADAAVAQQQIAALEAQLAEKQVALAKESDRARELEAQRKALKDEVASRESEKKQLLRQIKDLEDKLAGEIQKRKAELDAAHDLRKEALGASKSDFEQYIVISEQKIADLEAEVVAAEQKCEDLTATLNDKIQQGLLALRQLNAETTQQLSEKDAEIDALQKQLLAEEEQRTSQEAAALAAQKALQAEAEKLRAQIAKLQERALDLESENQVLRLSVDEKEAVLQEVTQQSELKIGDLQAAVDTQTALVGSLRLKLDILQGKHDEEVALRQDRERRVADLEAIKTEIEATAARQQKKLDHELEELLSRYNERVARIQQLELVAPERDATIEQFEVALKKTEADAREKSERLNAMETKLRDLQNAFNQVSALVKEKTSELDSAVELTQTQRKALETQAKEAAAQKASLEALQQRLEVEARDRTEEVAALEEQVSALKEALAESADVMKRAQGERDAAVADLDDRMQEYSINIDELQNALGVKEASIAMLRDKLALQEQKAVAESNARIAAAAAAETAIADLNEQIDELNSKLKSAITSSAAEMKQFKQRLADKQRSVEDVAGALAACEAELRASEARVAEQAQRAVEEARSRKIETTALSAQVSTLQGEKAALAQALATSRKEREETVADLNEQLAACKVRLEDQVRAVAIVENQLKLTQEKLSTQEQRTVAEVNARKAESSAHDEQVEELETQIAELEQRLSSVVDAHSNDVQALGDKIHQKKRSNAELSEKLAGAEVELKATQEALRAQEAFSKTERDRRVAEVSALEQQVGDMNQLCTSLQEEIAQLENRLAAAAVSHGNDARQLQEKLDAEKAQVEGLGHSLLAAQEALVAARAELAAQVQLTEEELVAHAEDNSAFQERIAVLEATVAELEDTLTKTRRMHDMSVSDLVEENMAAEARCEELADEITDLNSELEELRRNNSDLQAELETTVSGEDHEEAIDALRAELFAAEELRVAREAASLAELRTAQAELAELAAVEVTLKNEIEEINDDRKKALDAFKSRVDELETELRDRQEEILKLTDALQDKDADIQVLKDRLNEVEYVAKIEAEGAKSMLDSAENQRKSLVEAREVLQQRHRQALEDLAEAKNDANDLRKELAAKEAEVDRLAARIVEKEAHLVAEVNARAADAASYEERLDSLRASNSALDEALRAVRNECDDIAQALLVKESEHARAVKEMAKVVAARDASIEKLQGLLSLTKTANSELQAQIANLHADVGLLTANNKRLMTDLEEEMAVSEAAKTNCVVLEKKLAESVNARTAEKEAHRQEVELLEAARGVIVLELEAAQRKVDHLMENLRTAEVQLDAERDNHARTIHDKDATIAELSDLMKQREEKIEELVDLADQLEAESATHLVLANDRLAEAKALEAQLAAVEVKLFAKVQEAAELEKKVNAMEKTVSDLQEEITQVNAANAELAHQLQEMTAAQVQLTVDVKKLGQDLAASHKRTEDVQALLEEEIALAETLKVKLATQEDVHAEQRAALLAEVAGLKQMILTLEDEKSDLQQVLRNAERVAAGLQKEAKQLQASNDSLRHELEDAYGKSKRAHEALVASENNVQDLSSKLWDAEAAKQALSIIALDRLAEIGALQNKIDDLKAMLTDLQAQLKDKEAELVAANKAKTALAMAVKGHEEEIADQASEITRLEEELEEVGEESDKRLQELMVAQARADNLQARLEEEVALTEVLKVKLSSQEQLHAAQHAADQLLVGDLKGMLGDMQEANADLNAALAQSQQTAAALDKELKELQALHHSIVAELQRQFAEASTRLGQTTEALDASEEEVKAFREKLAEFVAVNQALTVAAQDRQAELNAAKDRLSDAVQQLLELKAEAAVREEKLAAQAQKTADVQSALQCSEINVAELIRQLRDAEAAKELLIAQVQKRVAEVSAALERADELQALLEEEIALAETLKVKLATQEDVHAADKEVRIAEVVALKARVLELQQAMMEAQDTIVNLAQQRRENEVVIAGLEKKLFDEAARIDSLKEQMDAKNKDVEALRMKLKDAASAASIRQDVADATIKELQDTQVSLDGTIAELLNSLKLSQNEVAERTTVVSKLAAENYELLDRVRELEAQVTTSEETIDVFNTDLDLQIAMVASLKTKLKALQEQLEESAHSLIHETASLEQCQAELQAVQAALRQSQFANDSKLAGLVEEEAGLQRVNALLAAQLHEKEQQAAAAEAKAASLAEQLAARQAELKRLEAELTGATGASRQSQRDLEERLSEAEARVLALSSDQVAQTNYINEVDAQRKALKAEVSGKSAEVLRLEAMLEKLQEECRDQAAHLAKLRVQYAAAQVRLEEEGHRRIRQLAAHEQRVSELEVAKVAADHVQQRYEAKIAALTNELNATSGSGKVKDRMSL